MTQTQEDLAARDPRHAGYWQRASLALMAVLAVAAICISLAMMLVVSYDPGRYAPALIAAAQGVTGRQVTLGGAVTIHWSLTPALQATDVAVANPPGFAEPDMLTIRKLRADIKLLPLFSNRVEILRLELIAPQLVLQRLGNGTANWDFSAAPGAGPLHSNYKVALERVEITDGVLRVQAANGALLGQVQFNKLTGRADSLTSPLHITAQAQIGATPFGIAGVMGPVARFSGIGTGAWPLDLNFTLAGAKLHIAGTVAQPRNARGYALGFNLSIPALDALGQALPAALTGGLALPPVQNITGTAQISDDGAALPAITGVRVTAGPSDLSAWRPGLRLTRFDFEMPALNQPLTLAANGQSDSGAFSLSGDFGPLAAVLPAAWQAPGANFGAIPVSVNAQIGAASASLAGEISTPQTLSGVALGVTAQIPDLSALSALAGMPLPAWKQIAVQTTLIDPGGEGLYQAAGLDGLTVSLNDAAFGGAASLYFGAQQKLQLALNFSQANLDALLAAWPPAAATVTAPPVAAAPQALVPPVPPAPPALPPIALPNSKLPFAELTAGNADIQLAANNVTWRGANYTALQAHALVANHVLTITPFTGELPGGDFTASAVLDASKTPAAEGVALKAPALALAPLLQAFGLGNTAQGNVQVQASASSSGDDWQDIAAHISGQLGIASVNDVVDAQLIDRAFGPVEVAAGMNLPPASGAMPVRCFGLALGASNGVVAINALTLDSARLVLQGSGSLDLAQGVYKISLQPNGGSQLLLGGSLAQPVLAAVGPPPSGAAQLIDQCPAALAAARFGQPGPAPPPRSAAPVPPVASPPNAPKNLNSVLNP